MGVEQRLVQLLLRRADGQREVRMSQERLAQRLGTAREVVSRTLRGLADRGLVSLRPGVIGLNSPPALRELVGNGGE